MQFEPAASLLGAAPEPVILPGPATVRQPQRLGLEFPQPQSVMPALPQGTLVAIADDSHEYVLARCLFPSDHVCQFAVDMDL